MASPPTQPSSDKDPVGAAAGVAQRAGRGHILSYGTDRLCTEPSCSTVLSRYNKHPVCALHLNPT